MSAVSGRACNESGRKEREREAYDNRVGCNGKSRHTVGPRVELVPSHGGCNSIRCLRGFQLRRWRRYPEKQWFAGQEVRGRRRAGGVMTTQ